MAVVLIVLIVALVLAVATTEGLGRRRQAPPPPEANGSGFPIRVGDLELVPASASKARAAAVLPSEGSEDARSTLSKPQLAEPDTQDYGPNPLVDFTVDLRLPAGQTLTTEELDSAFGRDWQRANEATFYGLPVGESRWTYVRAAGSPKRWQAIAVSKELLRTYESPPQVESAVSLKKFSISVKERARQLAGTDATPREGAADAAERAARFAAAWQECDEYAAVTLSAPAGKRFDGREIWDVMLSLGLDWGDMDLFHWPNQSAVGHDMFFSVSTGTAPGYFLPEELAKGVEFEDLEFAFSIPRSAAPKEVLEQMLKAARYAQRRLGGELMGETGEPFDEGKASGRIDRIVSRITAAGLRPGEDATLRIF